MVVDSSTSSCSSRKRLNSSRGADSGKYIAEDVMMNIFVRLPVKSIMKFRCVSKFWRSILRNPDFSTMWIKFNGFAECILFYDLEQPIKDGNNKIVPLDPNSNMCCDHNGFLFNFVSPKKLYLLASRDGLILCLKKPSMTFYVCNPLTNELDELVPPSTLKRDFLICGFVKKTTDSLSTRNYMVVLVYRCIHSDSSFRIKIFLSSLGAWNTYFLSCPERVIMLHDLSSNVVSSNGVLYWMDGGGRKIINVDLKNIDERTISSCKLINLPMEGIVKPRKAYQHLGESEGFIFYSHCYNGELSVWLLEDNDLNTQGASNWRLTLKVKTKDMQLRSSKCRNAIDRQFISILKRCNIDVKPLAFNPVDRNILILAYLLARDVRIIFTYNIKAKTIEQLIRSDDMSAREVKSFVLVPSLAR